MLSALSSLSDTPTIEISEHPDGWRHSKASVKKIGELITSGGQDPEVRQAAEKITAHLPSKSPTQEIAAIYQWVRKNIRFRYDPKGIEWLQSASRTLKSRAGDCDCITILIGSLCQSLGHKALTRTVGRSKKAPEHISALVWDRKRWINCDPVLEGPGDTGENTPGAFAAYAPGPSIVWNLKGNKMLGDLAIPPTSQELALWQFQPAFRTPTQAPTPDRRYSRAHTPSFGSIAWSEDCYAGYYWLPAELSGTEYQAYLSDLGAWGFLKKLAKVVGKVAKGVVSTVVPGAGAIISAGEALLAPSGKGAAAAAPGAAGAAAGATRAAAAATRAITQTPLEIKKLGQSATDISRAVAQMAQAQAQQGQAVAYLPQISAAVAAIPASLPHMETKLASLIDYIKVKDSKALKARVKALKKVKSAKAAKRQLNMIRKIARAEMKKATIKGKRLKLSGLGLRPTLSISLGDIATARAAAQSAVNRVNSFISKVGKPPEVSLPEVTAFQAADGTLTKDGLYGPNARAAAAWYLNTAVPPHSTRFKNAVTWKPPAAAPYAPPPISPLPAPTPAPPVIVRPPAPAPRPAPVVAPTPPQPVPKYQYGLPELLPERLAASQLNQSMINRTATPSQIRSAQALMKGLLVDGIPGSKTKARVEQILAHAVTWPAYPFTTAPTPPAPIPAPPVIVRYPTPKPEPAAIAIDKAREIAKAAILPTRAEIIRLEIASARGDTALLKELARVQRSSTARAHRAVKQVKKHLNGKIAPVTTHKKKDSNLWPVALAVLAFTSRS